MLFANRTVVRQLDAEFECAWESLRPVPKVHIDFGNGHTLDRTLNGNIAFWFVTPQGEAFDLVPGLVDARTFLARCDQASELFQDLREMTDPVHRRTLVTQVHALRLAIAEDQELGIPRAPDISKFRVEGQVKRRLAAAAPVNPVELLTPPALRADLSKAEIELPLKHSIDVRTVIVPAPPAARADFAKLAVEVPLKHSIDVRTGRVPDGSGLPVDTAYNASVRFPLADQLLRDWPLAEPGLLTRRVYKEILGVDLADPYLGLAPYLLGGEPGRDGEGLGAH